MKNISILILMLISIESYCQRKNIGDKLSSVKFTNLVNSSFRNFDLKQSKSKLLLLDFWSSRCGACISSMKKLADLKAKWKDDLSIILLTFDDTISLNKFFKKRPDIKALNLPMVPIEKKWTQWFPFRGIPHFVWIGRNHRVEAITSSEMVTGQNIEVYMKDGKIFLPEKQTLFSFKKTESLLIPKYGQEVHFSSFFSGPVAGIEGNGNIKMGDQWKYYSYNNSVRKMYLQAFRFSEFLTGFNYKHRILFKIKDSSVLDKDKWGIEKQFCYELVAPKDHLFKNPQRAAEYFKNDLNRFFGYTTEIIKRNTEVLVLRSVDTCSVTDKLESKETLTDLYIAGIEVPRLVSTIEYILSSDHPLLYEGPLKKKVTITLKTKYDGLTDLQKDLEKAGLTLNKEIREVKYLLVRDQIDGEKKESSGKNGQFIR